MAPSNPVRIVDALGIPIGDDNPLPTTATEVVALLEEGIEYQRYVGTVASAGDTTLVTPASGKRLVLHGYMVQNASSTVTTAIVKSGSTNINQGSLGERMSLGEAMQPPDKRPVDEALVLNLSGANSHLVVVVYREVDA